MTSSDAILNTSQQAKARGMTPEILEELFRDEADEV